MLFYYIISYVLTRLFILWFIHASLVAQVKNQQILDKEPLSFMMSAMLPFLGEFFFLIAVLVVCSEKTKTLNKFIIRTYQKKYGPK